MPTLSQATSDTLAKKLQSKKLAKIQREGRPLAIHHELLGRGGFVRRQQQHNGEVTHNHSRRPRFHMVHQVAITLNQFMGSSSVKVPA